MRFGGKYKLKQKLGSGSFGDVYLAKDTETGLKCACKLEPVNSEHGALLKLENKIYNELAKHDAEGIPRVHWMGIEYGKRAMIMDRLGTSLDELLDQCGDQFSLKTVLMLADQMITRVESLHKSGYIHRDIKPENFLMGYGKDKHIVYLVDMGLCKKYIRYDEHIPYRNGKQLTGTARYASAHALLGEEQSRRDDMIALGYVMMYCLKGCLPWQGIKEKKRLAKYAKIAEMKKNTPLEELCDGFPHEFVDYFKYCYALEFMEEPDYMYLRQLFKDLYVRLNYEYDFKYDWVVIEEEIK